MSNPINMAEILVSNTMALTVLFVVAKGNVWRLKTTGKENRALIILFITATIACINDPLCFWADGKSGTFFLILNHITNAWIYIADIIIAVAWIMLVVSHLEIKLHPVHRVCIGAACAVCFLLIMINFFTPVLYEIVDNVYERRALFGVNFVLRLAILIDGVLLYWYARRKSGELKFFQVAVFTIPQFVGGLIQATNYGLSAVAPFVTISIAGISICLQNEFLYRDGLTGLYNRFYLNTLEHKLAKNQNIVYTAMMLDINGFKSINDNFGHKVGDEALRSLSQILTGVVSVKGTVIRYAGDEFIVVLNKCDEEATKAIITEIHRELDAFNGKEDCPYKLAVSIGYSELMFKENTMDVFLDKIDRLMYENKREYYRLHREENRRS